MMVNRSELRQRAELYSKTKTFVCIIEKLPSGKVHFYHGFIIKVHDDFIVLKDRKLPQPFPILFESIEGDIEPSEQEETNV